MTEAKIKEILVTLFLDSGMSTFAAELLSSLILFAVVFFMAILIFWIAKKGMVKFLTSLSKRTKTQFDNMLLKNKVPGIVAY